MALILNEVEHIVSSKKVCASPSMFLLLFDVLRSLSLKHLRCHYVVEKRVGEKDSGLKG